MLSPAEGVLGMNYDVKNGLHPMIYSEIQAFTHNNWEAQERSYKMKNKLRKASESAHPMHELDSIVLMLSMFNVLLNMFL